LSSKFDFISVGVIHFEVRFYATERVGQGEVGRCHPLCGSAWLLLQLAVEKALASKRWVNFFSFWTKWCRRHFLHLEGFHFWQLSVWRSVLWLEI